MKGTLLTLLFGALAFVQGATACECLEYGVPMCEQVSRADTIFIGTLRSIDYSDQSNHLKESILHFDVEQLYKGAADRTVDVGYVFGTSCSWPKLDTGDRWVIYGYRNGATSMLSIPFCTGSHLYKETDEDILFLNGLKAERSSESVRGRLLEDRDTPLGDIPITITNGAQTFAVKSDDDGLWKVDVPGPGKYKVKIDVPFSAILTSYTPAFPIIGFTAVETRSTLEYEASVEKGLCSYRQSSFAEIDTKATASISGRMFDDLGDPVRNGLVYLAQWQLKEEGVLGNTQLGSTDEDGNYFFDGLREGRYVVLVNESDFPTSEDPYRRSYLPGVPSFSSAFDIELKQGEEIKIIDFRLPKKVTRRTIEIQAVWPDGKPVLNWGARADPASLPAIALHNSDGKYVESAHAKRSGLGKYSFTAFAGFPYILEVSTFGSDDRPWRGFLKIPANGPPKSRKVVVGQMEMSEFLKK